MSCCWLQPRPPGLFSSSICMFGLYWQLPSCLEALNHYLWWIIDHVHFRKILIKIGSRFFFFGGGVADLRRCFVWAQTNKLLNKRSAISFYYRQPEEKFCAGMKSSVTLEVSASLAEVHEAARRPSHVTISHLISRRCKAQLFRERKWEKHSASYFPQLIFVLPVHCQKSIADLIPQQLPVDFHTTLC